MTIHLPRAVLWVLAALVVMGAIVGAFLIGRSSDPASSPQATGNRSAACSESAAKRATIERGFAQEIRSAGDAAIAIDNALPPVPEEPFFHKTRGFRVEVLKCADLDEDGEREMVVGLGGGASGRIFHWAIFKGDGSGDWRLAFSRHGVPVDFVIVRDGAVVEFSPTYEANDPLCCPSGRNPASFDFVKGRIQMTSPRTSGAQRSIVVDRAGVTRLGPLDAKSASPVDARLAFGTPNFIPIDPDEACPMTWDNIGLEIVFANLGGQDPCGPEGRIGSFNIAGSAAQQAGWKANGSARIGMSIKELLHRYPSAGYENGQLVLVSVPTPYGDRGVTSALAATTFRGEAVQLRGYVGAAGE